MPEETNATTTAVDTQAVPPASTTPTQAVTTPTTQPQAGEGQAETMSLEEAKKLRTEAHNLRKRLKEFDDKEEQAKLAALSEVEKAKQQAVKAEQQIQQYREKLITAQVQLAAQAKGVIDAEAAALLVRGSLEYDDDGMPSNLDKALDTLIKNKPYLAPAKPAEPATTPAQTATPPATQTPAIPAMNPGRSSIASPNANSTTGKPVSLSDVFRRP